MNKKSLYEEYIQNKEFKRLMEQEDLITEVTKSFYKILDDENIKRENLAELFYAYIMWIALDDINKNYRMSNQINIIHGLISNLIEDSEDQDPLFSDTVSKHFWDLA